MIIEDLSFPNVDFDYLYGESKADSATERWFDLVLHAPAKPDGWPIPSDAVPDVDGYEDSPEAIAQHHAAWAIAFADAVTRLVRDRQLHARTQVSDWAHVHRGDPTYREVLYRADGTPVHGAGTIAYRLRMQERGVDLWGEDLRSGIRTIHRAWREEEF